MRKDHVSKWTLWHLRWAAKQWLEEHPNALRSPSVRKAVVVSYQAAQLTEEQADEAAASEAEP